MNTRAFTLRDEWLPEDASALADAVNGQFEVIAIVGMVMLFAAVLVVCLIALNRGERQDGAPRAVPVAGSVIAGAFGAALAMALFFGGLDAFVRAQVPPARARQIEAVADSAGWRFVYGPDIESEVLHVSVVEPVALNLRSEVGVARFSVPALRVAETVWPDATVSAWFHAETPGEYPLRASGASAAIVDSTSPRVVVHDAVSFDEWYGSVSNVLDRYPPVEAGHLLVQRNGCLVCHSTDGAPGTAPTFFGLFARTRLLKDGSTVEADSVYVRQSILEPQSQVVQGFEPVMPSFTGKLGDPEISAIRAWIASLDAAESADASAQEEGR